MRATTFIIILMAVLLCTQSCKPKNFDAEFREAEAKVGIGDNDAALALYRSIVNRYPDEPRRPEILLRIADLYDTILNDSDLAIEAYGRLVDEYPLSAASGVARERRARLFEKKGEPDLAIEDYSELIKHFPDSPDYYRYRVLLVGAYLSQRNFPQARTEVKPLLDDSKTPAEIREQALFAAGESYFLEDKPDKALPYYQEMLKEFPNSKLASEAELHLATCVEELGYLGTAREMTKEAAGDYPNKKVIDARLKSLHDRGGKALSTVPNINTKTGRLKKK